MRVEKVSERVDIPVTVLAILWEQIFRFCSRLFVDGFSSARKCSNSGRGLMQLDFTQFLSKLEKISPVSLKGLPDREYVDNYVKAYYLPESIMEEFIQSHSEYNAQQLKTLVNCALQGNKRSKQRLLSIIEEMEKTKR
ncbi:unnamed protein product [Allacma fusca]|uniref:Syndetin C-terminal domain-containing protein n=1 Tax=Allacma fusca TaxID=39272 RepID=A0A8J2KWL7_9HEXA|nr:unnamed protein product [Allacma fusca]